MAYDDYDDLEKYWDGDEINPELGTRAGRLPDYLALSPAELEQQNREGIWRTVGGRIPRGENERGHGRFSQTMKPMRSVTPFVNPLDRARIKRFGGEVLSSFKSASRLDQPSYKKNPGRRTKG